MVTLVKKIRIINTTNKSSSISNGTRHSFRCYDVNESQRYLFLKYIIYFVIKFNIIICELKFKKISKEKHWI